MTRVAIVDSGGANIASLLFAFERLGVAAELTTDGNAIRQSERVILPGVGAAKDAMRRLSSAGLVDILKQLEQPVLGICLGMQLLCDASEEENVDCLGIFPGMARKLRVKSDFPVPNMGWCATRVASEHPVLDGIRDGSWFYYLHSYAVPPSKYSLATAMHSTEFAAVLARDNYIAAQFHPERSSRDGARLLANFMDWQP